ncbi:MAG: secretion system protein F [Chloroflexota bacterium]|nr:MAG: secretion system protein F [Chloroflexota bacterium]
MPPLLLAIIVAGGIVLVFAGLSVMLSEPRDIEKRLGRFAGRQLPVLAADKDSKPAKSTTALTIGLERAIAKQNFAQRTARNLARADLKLTVTEYLVVRGATTMSLALVGLVISGFSIVFLLIAGAAGFFLPQWYVGRRQSARLRTFNDQLGDTISLIVNALRSGFSLLQAIDMVSREAPKPTAEEFGRVVREIQLGLSPEEALENLVRRIDSEDLDMMVVAINVQHEVGGNLSQILDTIGNTIRERVRIKGEITSLTAQQKYAGYIISAIPVLLGGVLYLINKDYMQGMFQGPFICMPIGGGISLIIGFLVIRKIVSINV